MKLQEQQIREILDAQRFEVNPLHEAAFRAMLDGKRPRRRTGLVFFIFLLAGAGLIAFSWSQYGDAISKSTPHGISQSMDKALQQSIDQAIQAVERDGPVADPIDSRDVDASIIAAEGSANADPVKSEMNSATQASDVTLTESRPTSRVQANVSGNTSSRNTTKTTDHNNSSTQHLVPNVPVEIYATDSAGKNALKAFENGEPSTEIIETRHGNAIAPEGSTQSDEIENVAIESSAVELVSTTLASSAEADGIAKEAAGKGEIIPATRLVMKSRFALGAALAWAPVGITWDNSGLSAGNQFQVAGFGTYRINPRWSVRADAGIGNQRGGFTFDKSSENDVFGFGLNKERYEMHTEQLYSVFLAAEMGRDIGKHQVFGGMQGQYLYGARGDIRKEQLSLDVPKPIVMTSENVWVSVSDLQHFSMQAFLGLRTPITSRIHLAASVRIPLLNTIRIASDAGAYEYEIQSPGIAPMFGLSYQLYQQ